jgi:hypothetical protein
MDEVYGSGAAANCVADYEATAMAYMACLAAAEDDEFTCEDDVIVVPAALCEEQWCTFTEYCYDDDTVCP